MTISVVKRGTRDSGDGMTVLSWDAEPLAIPREFRFAPVKACFRASLQPFDGSPNPIQFSAVRLPLGDRGDGQAVIRLAVPTGDVPDAVAYAKNGSQFEIDIAPADDVDASLMPVSPEERARTLKTLVVLSRDPGFIAWLSHDDIARLIDACERADPESVEQAAIEVTLRRIGAHSRSEILRDALVAMRAERLIRAYRATLFPHKDLY